MRASPPLRLPRGPARLLAAAALLALLAGAAPAAAAVELGLGADWIRNGSGELNLTLAADTWVARRLTVGGRFGVALFGSSSDLGVPVDGRIRLHLQRVYLEGLVGPWFLFGGGDLIRVHGALGFGLETRHVNVGLEVGALGGNAMLGVRLGFPI
jgi:hypothetical protein